VSRCREHGRDDNQAHKKKRHRRGD
jgi:hypothetical protein